MTTEKTCERCVKTKESLDERRETLEKLVAQYNDMNSDAAKYLGRHGISYKVGRIELNDVKWFSISALTIGVLTLIPYMTLYSKEFEILEIVGWIGVILFMIGMLGLMFYAFSDSQLERYISPTKQNITAMIKAIEHRQRQFVKYNEQLADFCPLIEKVEKLAPVVKTEFKGVLKVRKVLDDFGIEIEWDDENLHGVSYPLSPDGYENLILYLSALRYKRDEANAKVREFEKSVGIIE